MKRQGTIIILISLLGAILVSCSRFSVPVDISAGKVKPYDTATFNYIFVEAVKQKIMGNAGEALKLLEQTLKINPMSDAANFQIAQILLGAGNVNNAQSYALKAYLIDKSNFWYMMMLAGIYYQRKDLDSAIIFYEKAVNRFPEKEDLKITLANLYSENKKFEKANRIFEELEEKYGINQASTLGALKNLMWAEKYDEAMVKANELLKEYPDEILYNGLLAEIYRGRGEPEKAMEVYKKLVDRNPDNPEILLSLCDFLLEEKKYDDLLGMINNVIVNSKISRQDKITLFAQMIAVKDIADKRNNQLLLSLMVMEAAYKNDDVIIMLRPELLNTTGRKDEAIERLNEIISEKPENYFAWEKLLYIYFEKEDFKNLEIQAKECASRFNMSYMTKMLYATAATENENYEIAIEELRKAEIIAGNNEELIFQVLSMRADVYYRMKKFDLAFSEFDRALVKNRDDLTMLNNYAYYLAEQGIRLKEAEEMARSVCEKEKTNSTFLDTYAWVLYKRGKYKEAEKIMQDVLRYSDKGDAEFYEHYGYILKKRRNCPKAVSYWNEALRLDNSKSNLVREIENCEK